MSTISGMNVTQATNPFLIGVKIYSIEEIQASYSKHGCNFLVGGAHCYIALRGVMGRSGENIMKMYFVKITEN